MEHPWDRKFKI